MATEAQTITQSSTLPPAQPSYILRGHTAQIHAVHFLRYNLRLISGDADGWIVLWSIPIKRPVAVWKAHNGTILGLANWGDDRIITHGRDNKLHVWQVREEDETRFSTTLPIDDAVSEPPQPWLLHSLTVNALNFCSFTMCVDLPQYQASPSASEDGVLIATPGVQDGFINVTSLPKEDRVATVPNPKDIKTGMIMAIGLYNNCGQLTVIAGYESGHAAVWQQNASKHWQTVYVNQSHSQPILSLDTAPRQMCFFTSSADAMVARHALSGDSAETKAIQTRHAGQQSLAVRSDEKILATAGWDGRIRVYSAKSVQELAVLKWHKTGCYALAFAQLSDSTVPNNDPSLKNSEELTMPDLTVSERRTAKAKTTHWLAAGSKDGKVSLWDIY